MNAFVMGLVGAVGAVLVVTTLLSTLRTMVMPRSTGSWLTALVFKVGRRVFRLFEFGDFQRRDKTLAFYVPITVFALAGVWLVLVMIGYWAMFWAAGYGTPSESLWVSGSSLLTLGTAPIESGGHRVLALTEAAIGFGLVALLVSFLPSLYGAFSRREQAVALLDVRAGTPPSAIEMLIRFERIGWHEELGTEWARWEEWFADLDESHTTYPMLVWVRSPVPERSWLTAAATVMDAAALSSRSSTGMSTLKQPSASGADTSRCAASPTSSGSTTTAIRVPPTPSPSSGASSTRR